MFTLPRTAAPYYVIELESRVDAFLSYYLGYSVRLGIFTRPSRRSLAILQKKPGKTPKAVEGLSRTEMSRQLEESMVPRLMWKIPRDGKACVECVERLRVLCLYHEVLARPNDFDYVRGELRRIVEQTQYAKKFAAVNLRRMARLYMLLKRWAKRDPAISDIWDRHLGLVSEAIADLGNRTRDEAKDCNRG